MSKMNRTKIIRFSFAQKCEVLWCFAVPSCARSRGGVQKAPVAEFSPGATLSHYRIISKIGAGGMGQVYRAQDTELGRSVALKFLFTEVAAHQSRLNRFVQEAKAASALNHPNILTVYEIGRAEGMTFIATELVEGETLRHYMRRHPKLPEILDIAIQI